MMSRRGRSRRVRSRRVRRIGVLMGLDESGPRGTSSLSTLTQALSGLGWTDGRNVRTDVRWAGADINRIQALAKELVDLQPDIIVTIGIPATIALQRGDADDPDRVCERERSRYASWTSSESSG
jgi:putative ABC transport system substrate-binding protein